MIAGLCPVCRAQVDPTIGRNIPAHLDPWWIAACPAEGYPYSITVGVPAFAPLAVAS